MSIVDKIVDAKQLATTFAGPCLWLAGFAVLAGFGGGCWFMRHWDKGDIQEAKAQTLFAQKNFSDFKATLSSQSSDIKSDILKREREDADSIRERDQSIMKAIATGDAKLAAMLKPVFADMRSQINDVKYSCLTTVPLPDAYLLQLERPGGSAF